MRTRVEWLIVLVGVALGALTAAPAQAQGRSRALLIGVSNYQAFPHAPGAGTRQSPLFVDLDCAEDLRRIQAALVHTFHLDPAKGEIVTLQTPAQTTRAAILAALEALVAQTGPGDVVYIHYSGHGSQVPDPTAPGGLEDTIVPADYLDDQSNEITGKEIRAFLTRLQAKEQGTGQITLSFDCCHSATVTRGMAKKRGLGYADYSAWYQAQYGRTPPQPSPAFSRGVRTQGTAILGDLAESGYVVLSACANTESAGETQDDKGVLLGRFSDCLSQVLIKATPRTTYRQVYDQLSALFLQKYSDQTPALDGDPDSLLLGGKATEPQRSIPVSVAAPGQYILSAGSLQGMTKGSTFALYARDSVEFKTAPTLAEGTLTDVRLTDADLRLATKLSPGVTAGDLSGARAVETAHDYGTGRLTLDTASLRAAMPAEADAILTRLRASRMITDAAPGRVPDVKVLRHSPSRGGDPPTVQVVRGDTGTPLQTLDAARDLPGQVEVALQRVARYRYATATLSQEDPGTGYDVRMRLVPATIRTVDGKPVFGHDAAARTDGTFHVGDLYTIEVQNRGASDVFLTVLDIDSPDHPGPGGGIIAQAWPSPTYRAQNNILPAGAPDTWVKLWNGADKTSPKLYQFGASDPGETYKAIATDRYVSLQAVVDRDMTRGPIGPFDALLAPATGTRSGSDVSGEITAPAGWATRSVPVKVVDETNAPSRGIPAMGK